MNRLFASAAIIIFTCSTINTQAQNRKLQKANQMYDQLAFIEAIDLYKEVLADKEEPEAIIKLANCYRLLNDPMSAEQWFTRAVNYKESQPIDILYYAQALQQNSKYEKAKIWFAKYKEQEPDDPRGQWGIDACDKVEYFNNIPNHFRVSHLPFNSVNSDFGPAFFEDGITFASDRINSKETRAVFQWTGTPFLNVYSSPVNDKDEWQTPELLSGSANTVYHDGPVTFTSDYQQMFFTRSFTNDKGRVEKSEIDNVIKLKIMYAYWDPETNSWGHEQEMPFNNKAYSVAHPTLSPDGTTLIFASDMPGGIGGTDLWYTKLTDGEWGIPVNLGESINTLGEEMFPYLDIDSTLYFASNAWPGLGGLDVFYADLNRETGLFENPQNIGAPINTSHDDFALILDANAKSGYFTSNRPGGDGNDDIYSFRYTLVNLLVKVIDKNTEEPIESADLNISDGQKPIANDKTNKEGEYFMVIDIDKDYSILAQKPSYHDNLLNFDSREVASNDTLKVIVPLDRPELSLEGNVYNKKTNEPIDQSFVKLLDKTNNHIDTLRTGPDGFLHFSLSPEHVYYISASKPDFVYDEANISTKGIIESQIIHQDFYLEPIEIGVAIVLDNIYYDFDKANIREDASEDLEKVLRIMSENPGYKIELSSHTDSRGSFKYNERLSQRRAQSVVNWLVAKGISKDRLVPKGYGEYKLRNHCADGVECTEYEHQRNRRTEFTLLSNEGQVVAEGQEHFDDPNKKDEFIPGGENTDRERENGNLVPGQPSIKIDHSGDPKVIEDIPVLKMEKRYMK